VNKYGISKWDVRFMEMAKVIATWSKDPAKPVGALITTPRNTIVSLGFNGYPAGIPDNPNDIREIKLLRTIHAEENAILFAMRDLSGHSIYVTHDPCANCAAKIIQVGITSVYSGKEMVNKWSISSNEGKSMFKEAGVAFITMY